MRQNYIRQSHWKSKILAAEHNMTQAITQAGIEAAKAAIIVIKKLKPQSAKQEQHRKDCKLVVQL